MSDFIRLHNVLSGALIIIKTSDISVVGSEFNDRSLQKTVVVTGLGEYRVKETVEEVESLILGRPSINHDASELKRTYVLSPNEKWFIDITRDIFRMGWSGERDVHDIWKIHIKGTHR